MGGRNGHAVVERAGTSQRRDALNALQYAAEEPPHLAHVEETGDVRPGELAKVVIEEPAGRSRDHSQGQAQAHPPAVAPTTNNDRCGVTTERPSTRVLAISGESLSAKPDLEVHKLSAKPDPEVQSEGVKRED